VLDGDPARRPPRKGHSSPPLFLGVCCGHGRPSQLLLSSCTHSAGSYEKTRPQDADIANISRTVKLTFVKIPAESFSASD